jgi:uncharacterized protein involved in outer membrane biogenesis
VSACRRVGAALAAFALLVLGGVVLAFAASVNLDLSRWRDLAARQASAALGRPVAMQGALQLSLGRQLKLRVGDLRISNPPEFGAEALATVGEAMVRIDLVDALRGRPRLRGVEARDVDLRLERAGDGHGNWSFATGQAQASATSVIDVGSIKLQRFALRFHDERSATRRSIALDELSGSLGPGG